MTPEMLMSEGRRLARPTIFLRPGGKGPVAGIWHERDKDEIEIFYLPGYAPEHNPDKYLNNDLKQTIKNKPRAKTRDEP